MIVVGLTGGIGSGKSSVSARLAALGAVIVDADATTRRLQEPGGSLYVKIVERFGPEVVAADGTLDRAKIAAMVFPSPELLAELNAITHPGIGAELREQMRAHVDTDRVVVLDVPLLIENSRYPVAGVVVVDLPADLAVERLVQYRGMDEDDARHRIARQVSRDERLAKADYVIDNSGTPADLDEQIPALWQWMQSLDAIDPADPRLGNNNPTTPKAGHLA